MTKISGKVIVLGDNVDTDQILPGYAMAEPFETLSTSQWREHRGWILRIKLKHATLWLQAETLGVGLRVNKHHTR